MCIIFVVLKVTGRKTERNFTYPHRKGDLGDMPSTGELGLSVLK